MIQLASGILGAAAATLAFGAVHLEVASGNDLLGPRQTISAKPSDTATDMADMVERGSKGDRLDISAAANESGNLTIGFRIPGSDDSSVLMRIPVREVAKGGASPRSENTVTSRRMIACEPPVSVLTPIARQLGPARCVT